MTNDHQRPERALYVSLDIGNKSKQSWPVFPFIHWNDDVVDINEVKVFNEIQNITEASIQLKLIYVTMRETLEQKWFYLLVIS